MNNIPYSSNRIVMSRRPRCLTYSGHKSSLPNTKLFQQPPYVGFLALPLEMAYSVPPKFSHDYTRAVNRNHLGQPKPVAQDRKFQYGTAGFRYHADQLTFIVFRAAYLAGLRARNLNKTIGLMITASHNPEQDNGVKIVDPMGEMLDAEWEDHATELINTTDFEFPTAVRALETGIKCHVPAACARVAVARDTRASGEHLVEAARAGVVLIDGVNFEDHGILTTPQLHYIVRVGNDPDFGEPRELGYYKTIAGAFEELCKVVPMPDGFSTTLHLDCANGVGARQMATMERFLPTDAIDIHYHNVDGELNHNCGADFVKISKKLPTDFESVAVGERCAVFDGDADRLVYFYKKNEDTIELLDGDKIALLIAKYYSDELAALDLPDKLKMAIVQTAYANGNSGRWMENNLGISPVFVPTGVKHLHHEAIKHDIGVYFEANGHGTVVFSDRFKNAIKDLDHPSAIRLCLMSRVINEVVGDAIADMLAVEMILRHYGWSVSDWANLYSDAPSKQIKVPVVDRSLYKTTHDETKLIEPSSLQEKIDEVVDKYEDARAFVRPSGTENIVRVYAEALTQEDADKIGAEIEEAVKIMTA